MPNGSKVTLPVNPATVTWTDGPPGSVITANDLEFMVGGTVRWHSQRPLVELVQASAQSIASSTWTPITATNEPNDGYGGHNDTVNTSRWYPPVGTFASDYYLVTGYVPFSSTSTSSSFIAGGALTSSATNMEGAKLPGGTYNVTCFFADIFTAAPGSGDYLELRGFQNTGAAVNTNTTGKSASVTVRWVGSAGGTIPAGQPITPHVWIDQDQVTASATGSSPVSPGVKVPLNREARDVAYFLNNVPLARLTSVGSSQSITNTGVYQSVQLPTNAIDTYTGWSAGSNTRYTAQRAGLYLIIGYVSLSESSGTHTGYRACQLLQTFAAGGSTTYAGTSTVPSTGTNTIGTAIHAIAMPRMAVGDFVELQVAQTQSNAPTSLLVNNGTGNCCKFLVVWLSE